MPDGSDTLVATDSLSASPWLLPRVLPHDGPHTPGQVFEELVALLQAVVKPDEPVSGSRSTAVRGRTRTVRAMPTTQLLVEMAPIYSLDTRERLRPASSAHVRTLTDVLDHTPPILVLADGRRVLDGFMRLDAARELGRTEVRVQWVNGDEAAAWEQAIRTNASHGLPLTARQRRRAAERLLALAPQWSDRRIAAAVGVAPRSVGRWRNEIALRAGDDLPHLSTPDRVGRDGRRHLSSRELDARRDTVRHLLQRSPRLSDREIGRRAGVSPAAVHRLRAEQSPPALLRTPKPAVIRAVTGLARSAGRAVRRLTTVLRRVLRWT